MKRLLAFVLTLLLVASPAWAAVTTLDAYGSSNTDGWSYTVSAGSNRILICAYHAEGAITADTVTVTWGGQAPTEKLGTIHIENGSADLEQTYWVWNESAIAAGSGTTVTFTGELTGAFASSCKSYQGVNQTTLYQDKQETSTASSTPNPLTLTDIATINGQLIFGVCSTGQSSGLSWTGTNNLTNLGSLQPGTSSSRLAMANRLPSTTENADMECNTDVSPNRSIFMGLEFNAVGVGDPPASNRRVAPIFFQ